MMRRNVEVGSGLPRSARCLRLGALSASALVLALTLPGCSEVTKHQAQEVVRQRLKDPDSARFRDVRIVDHSTKAGSSIRVACGLVNGKNSYGAYSGYSHFIYVLEHRYSGTDARMAGSTKRYKPGFVAILHNADAEPPAICSPDSVLEEDVVDYGWTDPCETGVGTYGSEIWIRSELSRQGFNRSEICADHTISDARLAVMTRQERDDEVRYLTAARAVTVRALAIMKTKQAEEAGRQPEPTGPPPASSRPH
jgi:hypothetical protein